MNITVDLISRFFSVYSKIQKYMHTFGYVKPKPPDCTVA